MGEFKPMVKMMTTEPTVELKLKNGGSASHARLHREGAKEGFKPVKKMDGGVMGALSRTPTPTTPMGNMPAARAMAAKRPMRSPALPGRTMAVAPARPMMKKGGEMTLSRHASMPASKAHKGLKTGGVAMGQCGFKEGGIIKSDSHKKTTKMSTAEGEHHTPKKTGDVKMARGGMFGVDPGRRVAMSEIDPQFRANFAGPYEGYMTGSGMAKGGKMPMKGGKPAFLAKKSGDMAYAKGGGVEGNVSSSKPGKVNTTTGEVVKGNAGGYKKGGAPKKAFATGGVVNTGRPVAMSQGKKPPSKPVRISESSGTFNKGGKVEC